MPPADANGSPPDIEGRTFRFAVRVVKLCGVLDAAPGVRRAMAKQLIRCGTSIGANTAEAQAAQSHADFTSKMNIALKEARETLYWLRLLAADELMSAERLGPITQEADEISRIIGAIVCTDRANDRA
jgi:four helix bundle protein